MKSRRAREVIALLLVGLGLALSSCVVYEPAPYYEHEHHHRWR